MTSRPFGAARNAVWLSGVVVLGAAQPPAPGPPATTLHLEGLVTDGQLHSYIEVPFEVAEGTAEIAVHFDYDTRERRTTLDLGLWSPTGFRGWSGGSRSAFTVSESTATPGYLAGPIQGGSWRLVIGVPNIRAGVTARYTASIELRTEPTPSNALEAPTDSNRPTTSAREARPREAERWYRGDPHLHTEHSDGSCLVDGERQPCPLERTLAAARSRGLDFIAITEHNTVSHLPLLATGELDSSGQTLTVLAGQEVTTFRGHLNVIGISQRMAFRRPDGSPRDPNEIAAEARGLGAFVVINHPALPSGEACMGCGWRPLEPSIEQVDAVEVLNGGVIRTRGGSAEGLFSGIPFWQEALSAGRGWTAIGASDNHDPDLPTEEPGALGRPVTGVWARSARADHLLEGLRSGRTFVDVEGHPSRWLDVTLQSRDGRHRTTMGGRWTVGEEGLEVLVTCGDCDGLRAELLLGTASVPVPPAIDLGSLTEAGAGLRHPLGHLAPDVRWLRVDLRRFDGALVVLGNAIRFEADGARSAAPHGGASKR